MTEVGNFFRLCHFDTMFELDPGCCHILVTSLLPHGNALSPSSAHSNPSSRAQLACCLVDALPRNEVLASPPCKPPVLTLFSQSPFPRPPATLLSIHPTHSYNPFLPWPVSLHRTAVGGVDMVTRGTGLLLSLLVSPGEGVWPQC